MGQRPGSAAPTTTAESGEQRFWLRCPATWDNLGKFATAQWMCRAKEPSPDGFLPNCNVVISEAEGVRPPKDYLNLETDPDKSTWVVKRIQERPFTLDARPAFELIYDYEIARDPLRVLAVALVEKSHVFNMACSATPETFSTYEPIFRQIVESFRLSGS
jgi:hypothetical protein